MGQYYNFPNLDVIFLVPSYNSAKGLNLSPQSFNVINYATLYNALNGLIYNPSSGKTYNYQTPLQSTTQQLLQIPSVKNQITAFGINQLTDLLSNSITNNIFGTDSEVGRNLGSIFSQGISSAGNTLADNIIKGQALSQGLGRNVGASVGGAAAGVAANYIGQGINALGGDSKLSRGIGAGVATGLGSLGGTMASNLAKGQSLFNGIKGMSSANLIGLGGQVVGAGLQAAFGPSKEYGGTYGGITKGMDTAYDLVQMGVGFIPGVGTGISGLMALNKGLSNVFGSTSGMTRQDAILGSAFMPAPVKWLNMAGAKTTDTFKNQSWQNQEKATDFMQDSFGDLNDKFNKARKESGKTYGTFSRHAYNKAQGNLDFANRAWNQIMEMADLNVLQNIRSLDMTSINNQRYAQDIMGGFHPLYRGKQGMKIFNNTTNHNIGMRLLSAAALIDNKAMILSALSGTKVKRPKMRPHGSPERTRPSYMTEEEWNEYLEDKKRFEEYKKSIGQETDYRTPYTEEELQLLKEYNTLKQAEINLKILERNKAKEEAAARFNKQVNTIMGAMTLQANETPFTGLEYQQAAENLRQEKVEKFHEKAEELEKGFNAALMADLAVSAAPLLLRGFRWVFNKAGLLVKVPVLKTNLFLTSPYTGKWTLFSNREYRLSPNTLGANGVPVESRPVTSEVNWNPDYWFKTISGRTSYSAEEASELASHIPEYREIEKRLFDEGKLIINSEGNIVVKGSEMSPQEYIMRQSKAFQKMNPEHHYTGVPKHNIEYFEENPVDVESWSDRISPKNVEEYAFGNFKTRKEILDNIKYLEDLENKNGITESTQDWLKIYRLLLEDFDANIKLMKAKNHGRVYDITYPNGLNTFNIDALGNHWAHIPVELVEKSGYPKKYLRVKEMATDDIVGGATEYNPSSIVNIDNVMDTYDGTLLNETIIPRFVPKKSVLGNTGSFDLSNPSLFRSLIPLTVGGSAAATLYNKSK